MSFIFCQINDQFLLVFNDNKQIKINYYGRCHHLKNSKEASEDTGKSPAGCAGEGKQNKGNQQMIIGWFKDNRQ